MKKVIKNNIKFCLGMLAGLVISGITVACAQVYYRASEVSYNPTDSSFTAKTVEEALNKLYTRSNYLDEINTNKSSYGTFQMTTTKQAIEVGFKPERITMIISTTQGNIGALVYDSRISTDGFLIIYFNPSNSYSNIRIVKMPYEHLSITNTGFKTNAELEWCGQAYWYATK